MRQRFQGEPTPVPNKNQPIACVILAAGKGTRMRSRLPKVMHAIAHRPMVMHVIETARSLAAEKIVVVTAPDMQPMRDTLTRAYGKQVAHAVQKEQLGTGDAVKSALDALEGFKGTVLILFGDTPLLSAETLRKAVKESSQAAIVVLGLEVPAPSAYGRIVLDSKGHVAKIVEAKDANKAEQAITLCNSGVMAVQARVLGGLLNKLNCANAAKEYYLTDILRLAREAGDVCAVVSSDDPEELLGVNSRLELAIAERILQARLRNAAMQNGATLVDPDTVYLASDTKLGSDVVIYPHVIFGPGVSVGDGVEIRSFSHLEGAMVAKNVIIGPFARLRPGAVLGDGVHVGNFVEIKQSTLGKGAKANHLSYIGDAEVGEAANIGAGTITCNYDGYNKNRTHIGAGAFIGSNTSLVAPVSVGDFAVTGAGSVITEDVEANALAITRSPQKQKAGWATRKRNKKRH